MCRLSFSHTLSIRTWRPLTYWDTAKHKIVLSLKKKKKTNWSIPYQIWIQIWLTPISIAFPTCTDVLPLHRQNDTISHYINQILVLYPSHTYISFHHTFPVHHFTFQISPIKKKYINFLLNFTCTYLLSI